MVCCQCLDFIPKIQLIDSFPTDKFDNVCMLSKQNCSAHGYAILAKHLFSRHISDCSPSVAAAVKGVQNAPG
jgi:hypothetical protein